MAGGPEGLAQWDGMEVEGVGLDMGVDDEDEFVILESGSGDGGLVGWSDGEVFSSWWFRCQKSTLDSDDDDEVYQERSIYNSSTRVGLY